MHRNQLFIAGQWQAGGGPEFQSLNPCTQSIEWSGRSADEKDVNRAIESARHAFPEWSNAGFESRVKIVKSFQSILRENQRTLARVIATETGKPMWESLTEVSAMAGKIDLSIESHQNRTGETERELNEATGRVKHKPHGVVAVFGPYNFPGHLPNGHIVPALLAGNTAVFKPSELTPLVAEKTIEFWQQAGLPAGAINLLQGKRETGIALANHPGINGLFFTGSSATGAILRKQLAGSSKILALEMGGNNPLVVWEPSNLDAAVYHTVQSAFLTAGQRCTCARRLIIPDGPWSERFVDRLQGAMKNVVIGAPTNDPEPFMGPVISNDAAEGLLNAQSKLAKLGGELLVESKRLTENRPFLSPALIDVTSIESLPDEEYFGPLLQLIRVSDFDRAIQVANDTQYGLAAGLLCEAPEQWQTFYREIQAGVVNWNRPLTGASGAAPFGGIGASGNHRPSAYYAADYCAYPVATIESNELRVPEKRPPGIHP